MTELVTSAPDLCANDLVMAKEMADALHRHYPGHLWAVTVDGQKGIATVRNLYLSGNFGFVLRLPEIYSASAFAKDVVRAGGEVLERYRLSRGAFKDSEYSGLRSTSSGNLVADL